ncbi:MAG: hypothetical protein ACFCUT_02420 [Kiloniellaceae bacterium]
MIDRRLVTQGLNQVTALRQSITSGELDAMPAEERKKLLLERCASWEAELLLSLQVIDGLAEVHKLAEQRVALQRDAEARGIDTSPPVPKPRPDHLRPVDDEE